AETFDDYVAIEKIAVSLDRLGSGPQRGDDLARAKVKFEHALARAHQIKATGYTHTAGRGRGAAEILGLASDFEIDVRRGAVGRGETDAGDASFEHALEVADAFEEGLVDACAVGTVVLDILQGCAE